MQEFFDLWFLLLDKVVVNLARSWRNEDLARFFELETTLGECQRRDDVGAFFETGVEFLRTLYQYAGNRYLADTLHDLLPLTQRHLFAILRAQKGELERTNAFLQLVLKTIIARDEARLRAMMVEFRDIYTAVVQASTEALAESR